MEGKGITPGDVFWDVAGFIKRVAIKTAAIRLREMVDARLHPLYTHYSTPQPRHPALSLNPKH
jgi:hypothetical protein